MNWFPIDFCVTAVSRYSHRAGICNYYIENESGSKLERPELFRLLKDCQQNDFEQALWNHH
uniref:Resolvase n=1 Tax=Escherichia coli TaxID=562 RepID=A0A2K9UZS1_ECOLX|nr:Resolvase [Escherichia coli]